MSNALSVDITHLSAYDCVSEYTYKLYYKIQQSAFQLPPSVSCHNHETEN